MKFNRNKSSNPRVKYVLGGFIVLVVLTGTLIYNLISGNKDIKEWDRYMIIGKDNIFVVYEDKLAIKIPFDIQVDKDISFSLINTGQVAYENISCIRHSWVF